MLAETVEEWTNQWKQEGRQEGESILLQMQLERRFGPLPSRVQERLAQAFPEQLEIWGLELLDASTLDEVFKAQ